MKFTPDDAPKNVQETVAEALTAAGRSVGFTDYEDGARPDLLVEWWPKSEAKAPNFQGRMLRLEAEPSINEVTAALDEALASCEAEETTPVGAPSDGPPSSDVSGQALTWSNPVTWVGTATIVWWLVGPWLVRLVVRGRQLLRSRKAHRGESQSGGAPKREGVSR